MAVNPENYPQCIPAEWLHWPEKRGLSVWKFAHPLHRESVEAMLGLVGAHRLTFPSGAQWEVNGVVVATEQHCLRVHRSMVIWPEDEE